MKFADAAVRSVIESDAWWFELRRGGHKIAEQQATFDKRDGSWFAEVVFGPFPRSTHWDEVVLCSSGGVDDPDAGETILPAGRAYRHSVTLEVASGAGG